MITVNSTELRRFKVAADNADKRIVRSVRKQLRVIAEPAVEKVKSEVRAGGNGGGSTDAIAAATGLRLSFAKSGGGVRITTTNARLDSDHKGFVAAFNKPTFRHPVYGNRAVYVSQSGRPYFGKSIAEVFDKTAERAMREVFVEAVRAIGGHGS